MMRILGKLFGRKSKQHTEPVRRAGPDRYREMIERLKAALRQDLPVDMSVFERPEFRLFRPKQRRKIDEVRKAYIKRGQTVWNYARALTNELPEAEREREMAEIRRRWKRAGHSEF